MMNIKYLRLHFFTAIASEVPQVKTFLDSLPPDLSEQEKTAQIRTWMNQASNLAHLDELDLSQTQIIALSRLAS